MRMGRFIPSLVVAGLSLVPAVVVAQGVTVTSSTSMSGAGVIGAMMKLGGGGANTTTTYISGHKMRTDSRDNSMIIDVDGGKIINIDNKKKAYSVVTFEE